MNLRYINIWLKPETGYSDDYRYEFTLYTRFISNYFSKQIRKHQFVTDGTFSMVSIEPMPDKLEECKIVPDAALTAEVTYRKERYEQIKGTADCEYYLELLEEGFKKASMFKQIPLDTLLNSIDDFRKNGCKNEWQHKKKRFKEQDIEVILNCYFTTLDFRLLVTINKISTKENLCSGVVIRSKPDEIYFDKMFKDILIDKENIIITDATNSSRILINLKDTLNKRLSFKLLGEKRVIELLSYSNGAV
jgi:hypothetical protein